MKAKKKPIEKLQPSDLGVDVAPILETVKITEPLKRAGGTKVGHFFLPFAFKIRPFGLTTLSRSSLSMNWSPS